MKNILMAIAVLQIFYFNPDGSLGQNEIIMADNIPAQYQAWVVFSEMFRQSELVPRDVDVLGVQFIPHDGTLIIDLSREVLNYGGTYFEYHFTNLLLKNASTIPQTRYFTVLIEGRAIQFPEGVKIYRALISSTE